MMRDRHLPPLPIKNISIIKICFDKTKRLLYIIYINRKRKKVIISIFYFNEIYLTSSRSYRILFIDI